MFNQHRVGKFNPKDDVILDEDGRDESGGYSGPRRCLTPDEMRERGWELVRVGVYDANAKATPMDTWVLPGMLEQRALRGQTLHRGREVKKQQGA